MKSRTLFGDKKLPKNGGLPAVSAHAGQAGFTLLEILIVIGMTVIIMSFGLFFDFDQFRLHSFQADRDVLISALHHARSRAVSNICYEPPVCNDGKPHGVRIEAGEFIIFQGSSYAGRDASHDASLEANTGLVHAGINEVVFSQLTGDALSGAGDIILRDPATGRESIISINSEGQIIWTD